jgi:carboxyl-terminal processing protease
LIDKGDLSVKKRIAGICLAIAVILAVLVPSAAFAEGSSAWDVEYLKNVMDMIKEKYKGEISDEQLIEGALKGMFDTMDSYTTYFTSEEADEFIGAIEATYEGIGIMMSRSGDAVLVTKVFSTSPAERAGILQGDKIVSIDGVSVKNMSMDQAAAEIKGEAGTNVVIGLVRDSSSEVLYFEITREQIKLSPVTYEIRGDIGYIGIDSFNKNTEEFVNEALDYFDSKGIVKIVMDLRYNPGGDVEQAVQVAKKFVPSGIITTLDFNSEKDKDIQYISTLKKSRYKLVLLVNEMTASSSEILAGAVQDSGAGKLVGTKTFGKAKVQNIIPILSPAAYEKYRIKSGENVVNAYELLLEHGIIPLKNEIIGRAKITTGVYTTPRGRMIDGEGLEPDYYVENPEIKNGININGIQKLSKTARPGLNDEGQDVYNAEKILKVLGYEIDVPDMVLDEKTFRAVTKFRTDSGLYPGGVLDFTTQDALNRKLDELIQEIDKQYVKAVEILNGQ